MQAWGNSLGALDRALKFEGTRSKSRSLLVAASLIEHEREILSSNCLETAHSNCRIGDVSAGDQAPD